ncbi:MAG: hypothetical protein E7294_07355 [Lachnospiraceae bacterium]|nr:hypothetical protein [Lachnospiraceae bacterium]
MQLSIFGKLYKPSESFMNYVMLKHAYDEMAKALVSEFRSEFTTACPTADSAVSKSNSLAGKYVDMATNFTLEYLSRNKIYTVGKEEITSDLKKKGIIKFWQDEYADIKSEYDSIVSEANSEMEYRELRKNTRGRFTGGGFGVEGAIKGATQAGAMNLATGIAYSMFNSIGNSFTISDMNKKKNHLYDSICSRLCEALYETLRNFYWPVMDYLKGVNTYSYPSDADLKKARAIFQNIEAGRIPESDVKNAVVDILLINPLDEDFYHWMLIKFGDEDCEIEKFAEAFQIDVKNDKISLLLQSLRSTLYKIQQEHEYDLDKSDLEQDLIDMKKRLPDAKKMLGIKEKLSIEEDIDKQISAVALETRYVDGVEFKTSKEANDARDDLQLLADYFTKNGINPETVKEDVLTLEFKTTIITDRINEYIGKAISNANPDDVPINVQRIFDEKCFFDDNLSGNSMDRKMFYEYMHIKGISKDYDNIYTEAKKYCNLSDDEVVAFIIKNAGIFGSKRYWFIFTNAHVFYFESKDGAVNNLKKIDFIDIQEISATGKGWICIIKRDGSGEEFYPELKGMAHYNEWAEEDAGERLDAALKAVFDLLKPITKGRDLLAKEVEQENSLKDRVKSLSLQSWSEEFKKIINKTSKAEKLLKGTMFNDDSQEFKKLLAAFSEWWGTKFANETAYFIMTNYSLSHSLFNGILITSKNFYYLKEGDRKDSLIVPIEKVGKVSCFQTDFLDKYFVKLNGVNRLLDVVAPYDVAGDVANFINNMICTMNKEVFEVNEKYKQLEDELKMVKKLSDVSQFMQKLNETTDEKIKGEYSTKINQLRKKLEKEEADRKDRESRTYDGVLYGTIELRNIAEKESQEYQGFIDNADKENHESLVEMVLKIKESKNSDSRIKENYIKKAEKLLESFEEKKLKDICSGVENYNLTQCDEKIVEISSLGYMPNLVTKYKGSIEGQIKLLKERFEDMLREQLVKINYFDAVQLREGKEAFLKWLEGNQIDPSDYSGKLTKLESRLDEILRKEDGVEYITAEDARKSRAALASVLQRILNTSGNDVPEINRIINTLEESDIITKSKYIDYLKKEIELADKRYRTVNGKEYDSRETADQVRNDILTLKDIYNRIINAGALKSDDILTAAVERANSIASSEVKSTFLQLFMEYVSLWNEMRSLMMGGSSFANMSRVKLSKLYIDMNVIQMKAETLGLVCEDFNLWSNIVNSSFLIVAGKMCANYVDANNKYYQAIEHANAYLKYITEKNSTKQSFFSKIKTGVSGLVYDGYKIEYDFITMNGTRAIPLVQSGEIDQANGYAEQLNSIISDYEKKIEGFKQKASISTSIPEKAMGCEFLYIFPERLEKKEISEILGIDIWKEDYNQKSNSDIATELQEHSRDITESIKMSSELYKQLKAERKQQVQRGDVFATFAESANSEQYNSRTCWNCYLDSIKGANIETIKKLIRVYSGKSEQEINTLVSGKLPCKVLTNAHGDLVIDFIDDIKSAGGKATWSIGEGSLEPLRTVRLQ